MEPKSSGISLFIMGLSGPALLALGTWFPLVKTTLGYTYKTYGTTSLITYGVAIAVLALNLVSDKLPIEIAKRLHVVALAVLLGCMANGSYISSEGIDWFGRQTAFDAPSFEQSNKDAYWKKLYSYGYDQELFWVGNIRGAYERYGSGVLYNEQPIFEDAINSLTVEQTEELVAAAGIKYSVVPFGIVAYLGSLIAQLLTLILLGRHAKLMQSGRE